MLDDDGAAVITAALTPAGVVSGTSGTSIASGSSENSRTIGNDGADAAGTDTGAAGARGRRRGHYVRSASLFAHVADILPEQAPTSRPQLALRDLELLDGALAEAARWAGVPVTDLDT